MQGTLAPSTERASAPQTPCPRYGNPQGKRFSCSELVIGLRIPHACPPPWHPVSMAPPPSSKLSITEVGSSRRTPEGKQIWTFNLHLNGELTHKNRPLFDPLSEQLRSYLERLPAQEQDEQDNALLTAAWINDYRTKLFAQLNLGRQVLHRRIEIDVRESQTIPLAPRTDTIHCFQWEQLEVPQQWPTDDSYVTVRRIVAPVPHHATVNIPKVSSWSIAETRNSTINVLLVIARDISTDADDQYEDVKPSITLLALLRVRQQLKSMRCPQQLHIEVVRPGSYEALEWYLQRTRETKGHGYFHVAHFDMHGLVTKGQACLYFANDEPLERGLVPKPAIDVGNLLVEHGISSAVINACESARANRGIGANLGRIFIRQGISNILAMSYKFSSSAAVLFHTEFYESLFVEKLSFSEAACHARKALRDSQGREGIDKQLSDIQEWFVPVVYSNNRDLRITFEPAIPIHYSMVQAKATALCMEALTIVFYLFSNLLRRLFQFVIPSPSDRQQQQQLLQRLRHNESTRLRDGFADATQDRQRFLELDGQTLQLERDLIEEHAILLHGPSKAEKSQMVMHLSRIWLATNFVEQVYVIQAKEFLEGWLPTMVRETQRYLRGDYKHLYTHKSRPLEDIDHSLLVPKTVVFIDQIDDLFSPNLTDQQQARGRAALEEFLSKVTTAKRPVDRCPWRPYLVLVGRQGIDWFDKRFGHLNLAYTPIHRKQKPSMAHIL